MWVVDSSSSSSLNSYRCPLIPLLLFFALGCGGFDSYYDFQEMEGELRLLTVPYTYEAVLRHVVLILRNFLPECLNVFPIVNAKVPIVRFQSEISHNSCDIKLDDHG